MTKRGSPVNVAERDDALRERIMHRAQAINIDLVTRLATVADDLAQGHHLAALGGIDGLEQEINTMRSFLLLLTQGVKRQLSPDPTGGTP